MQHSQTLLWYDLETFGLHNQYDKIAQFAAIRTNTDLEIIQEPIVLYCKIPEDYLPDPLACLVTGITPQLTLEKGLPEREFMQKVFSEFSKPNTCVVGYNSIAFDDEFIRNALYRNFFDPYVREYANGNSRWDVMNMLRAAHDLRPDGIKWPINEKGRPSFRLESLTKENGISHEDAHDALADVYATISVARLVKDHQPNLYDYSFTHRSKRPLKDLVNVFNQTPFLHTSGIHTTEFGCSALMMPITADPHNSNGVLCFDLSKDPRLLLDATPDELREHSNLVKIGLNKCPFISPVSIFTDEVAERLHIDKQLCRKNFKRIRERHDLPSKIHATFSTPYQESTSDPDFQIYSGGFFPDTDRDRFSIIRRATPEELMDLNLRFEDKRVSEMLWRYTCRNYPEALSTEERRKWHNFCASRLLFPPGDVMTSYQFYTRKIKEKVASKETTGQGKLVLKALEEYGEELHRKVIKSN